MFSFGIKNKNVKTGVAAPTTSTVGYLGEVRFDTDGNRWECVKIVGSVYYWALPFGCLPVVNTEYISHLCGGKIVYAQKISVTPSTTTFTVTHNIPIVSLIPFSGQMTKNGVLQFSYYGATTDFTLIRFTLTNYVITTNTVNLNIPYEFTVYYTKD